MKNEGKSIHKKNYLRGWDGIAAPRTVDFNQVEDV